MSRSISSRGRGRYRRWGAHERATILRRFTASGLGLTAFAQQSGVPRSSLSLWRREARRAPAFATVTLAPASAVVPASGLVLRLHGASGLELELTGLDATTALELLRKLATGPVP